MAGERSMKAAVLRETRAPFRIEEVPVPAIGPDEVLVRTRSCGICRTDLHIQDGLAYTPGFPLIPGHEPAGTVEEVGGEVSGLAVGQRVVPHLFVTCGQCAYCRAGEDAQCSGLRGILGVTLPGGFAEYFVAPARNLLPLPQTVSFAEGGLVSCAVITAVHAYRRAGLGVGGGVIPPRPPRGGDSAIPPRPTRGGDCALVLGAGGIGQILVQLLRAGGLRVAAASRSAASLDAALRAGAHLAVSLGNPHAAAAVREFSGGEGVDCVFECVGTAATMKAAAGFVRRGGAIIVIGEEADFPGIDTIQIAQRELRIVGSRNGSRRDAEDALKLMSSGQIRPPIARRYPLSDINEAMEFLRSGGAHGRLIVDFE
jgi:D-arabinose 1-dehydrogenase-like Zn-dependent alcohol dehydrogenase